MRRLQNECRCVQIICIDQPEVLKRAINLHNAFILFNNYQVFIFGFVEVTQVLNLIFFCNRWLRSCDQGIYFVSKMVIWKGGRCSSTQECKWQHPSFRIFGDGKISYRRWIEVFQKCDMPSWQIPLWTSLHYVKGEQNLRFKVSKHIISPSQICQHFELHLTGFNLTVHIFYNLRK